MASEFSHADVPFPIQRFPRLLWLDLSCWCAVALEISTIGLVDSKASRMEISDLFSLEGVIASLRVTSKKQALQNLARRAAEITGEGQSAIFEVMTERERLGTTGLGNGIAIPHGKLAGLDKVYGLFARLETPIDFDALNEQPVDLICPLLAPESAGADHLRALAQVSRLLRDPSICKQLRSYDRAEEIHALLTKPTTSRAA